MKWYLYTSAVCLLTACGSNQEAIKQEAPLVPVRAEAPAIRDVPITLEVVGTLAPSTLLDVRPKVDGHIEKVFVNEGEWLDVGSPLFRIDSRPYANKMAEMRAEIAKDRAQLEVSLKKLERYKNLAQKELIAQNEWDELESLVTRAKNAIKLDHARLQAIKLDLEQCTIKSPIKGRAGKLDAHVGQLVTAGQGEPLVQIAALDPLKVEFQVTEKELASLSEKSLDCQIQSLALPTNQASCHITFIDNQFEPASGQILVRAKVPNGQQLFRPGQAVRVKIPIDVQKGASLVKQKAIKYNQTGPYVYVIQPDSSVMVREVVLGKEFGDEVVIAMGIEPTDVVVTEGHMRLFPGAKVEIKTE